MSTAVGAFSARLPDDAQPVPFDDVLTGVLVESLRMELADTTRPPTPATPTTPAAPTTTEMLVLRPPPRGKHLAPADSPVGRAGRRTPAVTAVERLAQAHDIDLSTWPNAELHLLAAALLEEQHRRIARWRELVPLPEVDRSVD